MPRYRALQRGQIPANDVAAVKRADQPDGRRVMRMIEAGEEFEFNGPRGKWMQPLDGDDESGGQTGKAAGRRSRSATGSTSSETTSTDESGGQTGQAGSQAPDTGASASGPASQ